jgi:hypothetical protein
MCAAGLSRIMDDRMFASPTAHATGMPVLDAQADFRRARRAHAAALVGRWLARRGTCSCPPTLSSGSAMPGGAGRLKVIPLGSIVGTLEPTSHFDARFRPASEAVRHRWEKIALAHRRGTALPPIELRPGPGGYYVVDGRHRVSVARALGLRDIDGWVVGPRVDASRDASASISERRARTDS